MFCSIDYGGSVFLLTGLLASYMPLGLKKCKHLFLKGIFMLEGWGSMADGSGLKGFYFTGCKIS